VIKTAWFLDIATTTGNYVANFTDKNSLSWTWAVLNILSNVDDSCYTILKTWRWTNSWIYTINPSWNSSIKVYCDMTTDWGGWTLVWRSIVWWSWDFWWYSWIWNANDDTSVYSLWSETTNINFNNILIARYETWKTISLAVKVWISKTVSLASSCEATSNQTTITTSWIPSWESWWNHRQMTYFRWETNGIDAFHFRDSCALFSYGLYPWWYSMSSYNTTYWSFHWKQWMIFVK
jgi:hypothetical protein